MPSAWAARLKLSNCATLTKTAMSLRSATPRLLHGRKRHSRYLRLIEKSRLCQMTPQGQSSPWRDQMADKTVIITGASQGIGAGLANRFLERGYNVVATSRRVSHSAGSDASHRRGLV